MALGATTAMNRVRFPLGAIVYITISRGTGA